MGQRIFDLRLPDQYGEMVSLWQLYGHVLIVSVGTVWCSPCRDLAERAEDLISTYDELIHVTVLLEDASGFAPEISDAGDWAEVFCPDSPVLIDPKRQFEEALDGGYPEILIISRDLVVYADPSLLTDENLRSLIEEAP